MTRPPETPRPHDSRREIPLNADPADQLRLLDLQALDTRLDQLAHRRKNLPEHAEIEKLGTDQERQHTLLVAARTQESDLAREQSKAEQSVDQVRQRAARDQQRLDSGAVTSPRDLDNLQREIVSLAKRQADLEDAVLEVMERIESTQARVAELTAGRDGLRAALDTAETRRDEACEQIDADQAGTARERETVAAVIPAELFGLYTKLRAQNGGVGAARLYQRRCDGCRIELGVTDLNAVRSAPRDQVVRCENCRRILVRTAESGL